jgi:hypothetical protein
MLFWGCSKVKYHQISGMMWRELLSKVAISHCVRMMKIWSTRLLQSISEGVIRGTVPSSRNPIICPKSCGHTYLGLLASLWVSGRWNHSPSDDMDISSSTFLGGLHDMSVGDRMWYPEKTSTTTTDQINQLQASDAICCNICISEAFSTWARWVGLLL